MNNAAYYLDTHCHLNLPAFSEDWQQVVEKAAAQNVRKIIVPGINLETSAIAQKMAEENPAIFFAAGVHPNDSNDWQPEMAETLAQFAAHPKCIAIGEIGLDFYREYCPPEIQLQSFKAQLKTAGDLGKPVLIHCRQAFDQLWPLLNGWKQSNPANSGVLHAFDEDADAALEAVNAGFYLGIGGAYTYKKVPRRDEILLKTPLEAIILETDAPYLTPLPYRGQRNEPMYIPLIAEKVAALKNLTAAEVCARTMENSLHLFEISE
mgnify:CR=1 FL=1